MEGNGGFTSSGRMSACDELSVGNGYLTVNLPKIIGEGRMELRRGAQSIHLYTNKFICILTKCLIVCLDSKNRVKQPALQRCSLPWISRVIGGRASHVVAPRPMHFGEPFW